MRMSSEMDGAPVDNAAGAARLRGRKLVLRRLWLIGRVAVTVIVSVIVLHKTGAARMAEIASQVGAPWIAAAIALALLQLVFLSKRWQYLYAMLSGSTPGLWRTIHLTGQSLLFGQLLPSTVGTDLIRAGAMARDGGVGPAARSVVIDRLAGLIVLTAIVTATLPIFAFEAGVQTSIISLAAASLGLMLAAAGFILARSWLTRVPLIGGAIAIAASDLRIALSPRGAGPRVVGLSGIIHFLAVAIFALLLRSAGTSASLLTCIVVVPSALLIASIPVSLGGWGVREAAIASGFSVFGGDAANATTASILFGLTTPMCAIVVEILALLFGARATSAELSRSVDR